MVLVKPNSNFYFLGGKSVHEDKTEEYKNYRRCWIEYPSKFFLRDFPMHLDLESSSRCNLKCTFCDKLPFLSKDRLGDMDFPLYKKILDEASEHKLWGLKLSYRGEPLLNKNIVKMVAYAKKKGIIDVYFNTNGVPMGKAMSERLIDAGLDRVSVSIEGTDPKSFERERIGAKFDTIVRNIYELIEIRERKGAKHPKVRIQTVFFPGLNLDEYSKFWQSHCDEVAAVDYKDESNREEGIEYDWACPQLWQRMTIEWDGSVFPCNNDDLRLLTQGNANSKTIYECWHNERVSEARKIHKNGESHRLKACDGCPWRTAQIKKTIRLKAEKTEV